MTSRKKQSSKRSKPMSWKEFILLVLIILAASSLFFVSTISHALKVEPTPIECPEGSSTMFTYHDAATFIQVCTDLKDVESIINTAYNLSEASQ